MAVIAACTDKGAKRSVNQDACCVQVADTAFGEVILAVVCDGVGGLASGELASATVVYRFAQWFRQELPTLLAGMDKSKPLDLSTIQLVWGVLLNNLNEIIQAYGRTHAERLGTTFSGIFICGGRYLIGHVGDCRVYQIGTRGVRQVTEDQTLLNKQLAAGEITPEEALASNKKNVILQAVGTEGMLKPAFYAGTCTTSDLFVICCDGAYQKAEEVGVHTFFENVDIDDEDALTQACRNMLSYDIAHGERDNLTVVCVRADEVSSSRTAAPRTTEAATALGAVAPMPDDEDEDDDLITMVQDDEESVADEDDLPTEVEAAPAATTSEDDIPTEVGTTPAEASASEDDIPTEVGPTPAAAADEDDLPTTTEGSVS